eukprot:SAG11_NODE_31237_length_293_cov_1.494845_1_plen_28_part_10
MLRGICVQLPFINSEPHGPVFDADAEGG